jgi:hypothetical protein
MLRTAVDPTSQANSVVMSLKAIFPFRDDCISDPTLLSTRHTGQFNVANTVSGQRLFSA